MYVIVKLDEKQMAELNYNAFTVPLKRYGNRFRSSATV